MYLSELNIRNNFDDQNLFKSDVETDIWDTPLNDFKFEKLRYLALWFQFIVDSIKEMLFELQALQVFEIKYIFPV